MTNQSGAGPTLLAPTSLRVNGEPRSFPADATVLDAVGALLGRELRADGRAVDGGPLGMAVALDDTVVPRSRWGTTPLAGAGRLEIVTAVQGG